MIISTKLGTPKEELEKLVGSFEGQGIRVSVITGTDYTVIGLVGDTTRLDEKRIRANPYVDNVQRVSEPYKLANRLFHHEDSVISVRGIPGGGQGKAGGHRRPLLRGGQGADRGGGQKRQGCRRPYAPRGRL